MHTHDLAFRFTGWPPRPYRPRDGPGEIDDLLALLADDDHQKLIAQATTIAQDFTVTVCQGGSDAAVQEGMARYVSALQEVGWMT